VGPTAFVEVLAPLRLRAARLAAGLAVGYLHDDVATTSGSGGPTHLVINQLPVLALVRYPLPHLARPEIAVEAGAGLSMARTVIEAAPADVSATAHALALDLGVEAAVPLKLGRIVAGLRYLWISLGRTSHDDDVQGNSAGLLCDLGYRLSF